MPALQFQPIDEYLDDDGITLPIRGKDYTIQPPDALTGLEVSRLMSLTVDAVAGRDIEDDPRVQQVLDAHTKAGESLENRVLGPALDEMVADGVPWPSVQLAFQTTMLWITQGAEVAARYWAAGGGAMGKAPQAPSDHKPKRTTRKAQQG